MRTYFIKQSLIAMFGLFFKDFIYLFMRDTERQKQAEGEAGSLQLAQCRLKSRTPRSRPEPKADTQPMSYPGILLFFDELFILE